MSKQNNRWGRTGKLREELVNMRVARDEWLDEYVRKRDECTALRVALSAAYEELKEIEERRAI